MVGVKLYVEGGGDTAPLRTECRRGFRHFLEKAGIKMMPRIVACGSRRAAYDKFRTSIAQGETALLLIDSEDPISFGDSPWKYLATRPGDGFAKPDGVTDDCCHFMVSCMESWFMADKNVLSEFFEQDFNINLLPKRPDIESIPRDDIYKGLQSASANCKTKAKYGKGDHSFKILSMISPTLVRSQSKWADRFLNAF